MRGVNEVRMQVGREHGVPPGSGELGWTQISQLAHAAPTGLPGVPDRELAPGVVRLPVRVRRRCSPVDALRFVNSATGRELNLRGINTRIVSGGTVRAGDAIRTATGAAVR